MLEVPASHRALVVSLLQRRLPHCSAMAFGSRVSGWPANTSTTARMASNWKFWWPSNLIFMGSAEACGAALSHSHPSPRPSPR